MSRSGPLVALVRVRCLLTACSLLACLALGCGPERQVLDQDRDAAQPDALDAAWDEAAPTHDSPVYPVCKLDDAECELGSVCENQVCTPCDVLPNHCLDKCDYGAPEPVIRNGCAVCQCPAEHPCYVHAECPNGSLCAGGTCQACAQAGDNCSVACAGDTAPVAFIRNGCPVCECVPKSDCAGDADCGDPATMHCYPGSVCENGCDAMAKCCYGNICGPVGCPDLNKVPCSAVGCPSGLKCETQCPRPVCTCDGIVWDCQPPCDPATCVPAF